MITSINNLSERKSKMSTKDKINFVYDLETSGIGKKFPDKPFDNVAWEQI